MAGGPVDDQGHQIYSYDPKTHRWYIDAWPYNDIYNKQNTTDIKPPTQPPGDSPGGGSSFGGSGGGGSAFPLLSDAYKHAAWQYGLKLSQAQETALMKNGVSPDEFAQRLAARQTVEEYRPSFNIFGRILQNNGVIKGNLTDKELLNFTLGAAPAKWYALWERIAAATAAQKSGYSVYGVKGKGGSPEKDLQITGDDIKSLLNLLPDRVLSSSDVQQGFATASQLAQQIGGETRYRSTGITRADLIHHAFGVADANTEEKINRAIETQQNETQIQNQGGLQQSGTGVQNIGLRGLAGANSL